MRPPKTLWEIVKITKWKKVDFSDKWEKWYIDIWILRTNQIVQYTNDNWVECNENDILIAWDWSKSWTIWYWLNWIIWSTLAKLEITEKDIYTPYVWEFLKSKFDYLNTYTSWAAIPHIRKEVLVWIEIPLPPLETQKAIVAKLDQIFAELDQTKSEIQKNLDNTEELWKSALDQAFQGDWEMKKLGEVCDVRDWTHDSPKYYDEWIPFITSKNLKEDWIDFDNVNYISKEDHINFSTRSKVEVWDILFAMIWTIWNPTIVKDKREFSIKNVALIKFWWAENILNTYVRYLLDSNFTINNLSANSRWWTQKFIALKDIRNFVIPVPPLSEQEKIVEYLDQVSKEVKALKSQYQSQLDNLEKLKKSVLDKAFRWELGE